MTKVFDNWERLVRGALRREQLWLTRKTHELATSINVMLQGADEIQSEDAQVARICECVCCCFVILWSPQLRTRVNIILSKLQKMRTWNCRETNFVTLGKSDLSVLEGNKEKGVWTVLKNFGGVCVIGMMVETRNTTRTQEPTMESLQQTVNDLQRMMQDMANEMTRLRSGEGNHGHGGSNGGQQMQYSRVTRIEFPKFSGEDVRGWLFRCEQFFKVDSIADEGKVNLVSIHLHDIALMWHRQFIKIMGENVDWEVYRKAILKRFGLAYDDPLFEIKKIGHVKSVQEYIDEYDKLLCRVDLTEEQSMSFFLAGLQKEIEVAVRMFSPKSLAELYGLAKFQEANGLTVSQNHYCLCQTLKITLLGLNQTPGGTNRRLTQKDNLITDSECKNFKWYFRNIPFATDVMLLPLGGCEMVLGIQWLATLGDMICNFKDLRMEFKYNGKRVLLREATCMKIDGESPPNDPNLQLVIDQRLLVIDHYQDVFATPTKLPPQREHDHRIPLVEGAAPVKIRPYRHPPTQKNAIEGMVKELLEAGVIKKSHSPFSSPIVMVKKKDNSWRMCIDYRQLNKQPVKDKFPIPLIEELIDELHGSKVFTKLDLRSGYHQIRMCEEIAKTTFKTHEGHYKFLCVFGTGQVEYLGHVISVEGVATADKIKAMANWPVPANIKQLRGFLGLTSYYRRFIRGYATISKPLTQLLKKNTFAWSDESQTAFEQLKQAMLSAPVLRLPDFTKEFTVEIDAS
ncbi:hypothetical protein CTI12_AA226430 [Artemisia annua]|uniref:Reverse transcriptase domain-containing protein n=1 Tax=Artemisia annua TaxID=35608 RepID=A0A2U1NUL0_ARTAN|nr:hypothetical protein CTI12_AA226430 [Artemisia annua]